MKRAARLAGLLLAVTITLPALADKANDAYKRGVDAEARQNYVQAYDDYKIAFDLKPKELKYRAAFTRIRFYASSQLVHEGQQLRDQGKLQDALADFQKAASIDPSNFYAAQELRRTQKMIEDLSKGVAPSSESQTTGPISQLAEHAAGPVELRPISNTPITLRMTEDSKVIYTAIEDCRAERSF
jgi:general secretion pathway protein D